MSSFAPLAFAVFHAISKFTDIEWRILPLVLAEAVRFAIWVLASIVVAIGEVIWSLPMLQTKLPFTFVSIAVLPLMYPITISFTLCPLANIRVPKYTFPDALTFFEAGFPFTLVDLTVDPRVNTLTMRFIIFEVSLVFVSVRVAFHTPTVSVVA